MRVIHTQSLARLGHTERGCEWRNDLGRPARVASRATGEAHTLAISGLAYLPYWLPYYLSSDTNCPIDEIP